MTETPPEQLSPREAGPWPTPPIEPAPQPQPPAGWWLASDGNWYPPNNVMAPPPPTPVSSTGNGIAVAAFVCGLIGFLFGWIPFTFFIAWILGVLGVVFGLVGLSRVRKQRTTSGKGLATAGLVLGGLSIIMGIIGVVLLVNAVDDLSDDLDTKFGDPSADEYEISNTRCEFDGSGRATYTGDFTNKTGVTRDFWVTVTFKDKKGTVLDTGTDFLISLAPGSTAEIDAGGYPATGSVLGACEVTRVS